MFAVITFAALVPPWVACAQGGILPSAIMGNADQLPAGARRVGNVEIANIDFENQTLFTITAPVVRDL